MPLNLQLGNRRWSARWGWIALALAACAAFTALGFWQWGRGEMKSELHRQFTDDTQLRDLGRSGTLELPRYARVRIAGRYDGARQFLLENLSHAGRPGYHVLTPLQLLDGRRILVDRGWLPFSGYRERLPDVSLSSSLATSSTMVVRGRLDELPQAGLPSGRAAPAASGDWPRLATFPTHAQLEAALGERLEPRMLLLDRAEPHGYVREWRPPGVTPQRHYAYAVQWWALALAALVLLLVTNLRRLPEAHRS